MSSEDILAVDYRPCVGIMLLSQEGKVFVGWRKGIPKESAYGWQMPQGGIDSGETVEQAAFRELEEEIGTSNATFIVITPQLFKYDVPTELREKRWSWGYKGQSQRWILMRFQGSDADINLDTDHPEFEKWQWVNVEALEHLVVPFKKETYKDVIEAFRPYITT